MPPKTEERPFKRCRLHGSFQDIVTLVVGDDNKPTNFSIHQNILCEHSDFFEAACKPEWMKPEDRVIKLPEDNRDAIEAMVYWMYHNVIVVPNQFQDGKSWGAMNRPDGLFARLYVLGEKYHIPRLQNDCIDANIEYWENFGPSLPEMDVVNYIYENTLSQKSSLRRWIVRRVIATCAPSELEAERANGCVDFFFDLAIEALEHKYLFHPDKEARFRDFVIQPDADFCKSFHGHGGDPPGEPCTVTKSFRYLRDLEYDSE